jgi:hypothetical protein
MKNLLWLIPLIIGLAAVQWPKLQGIALLTMLVCGVAYLVRRVGRTEQAMPPLGAEQKRDYFSVQRDIPPPPN